MGKPLASAVIITYNQEKYIEQTIECALAQKVDFEYEIIIGEDCSTDKTREICLQYQKKYPDIIRVITSNKNVGLLDNWYRSVNAARGKYIAGCGGDDYWHDQEKLQKQVNFLENNQEYGMVHSDADFFYEEKNTFKKNVHLSKGVHFENENTFENIFLFNNIIAGTVLFKKMFFEKYFCLEELKKNNIFIEDAPLWIEISSRSKIFYMNESLLTYRIVSKSISRPNSKIKEIYFHKNCYNCMLHYYNKYNYLFKNKKYIFENIHWHFNIWIFNIAFEINDKKLSLESYRNIIENCGKKYLTRKDKLRYLFIQIPYGSYLYKIIRLCLKNFTTKMIINKNIL